MKGAAAWLVVSLALAGCGNDGVAAGSAPVPPEQKTGEGCAPGELALPDGACRTAGLPPDWVEPPAADWSPVAGVPPDVCAAGFVPEDGGCTPVLPATPCGPGQMAVPGETACRDVAACASGTWGDIPTDATTQHVDASFAGTSDGSAAAPWTTVQQAVDVAAPGAIVAVAAGSYAGDVVVSKPVRIWGRCPALVEIVGATEAAIDVLAAPGTEVHALAVRGAARGIRVEASPGVVVDRIWAHDTALSGVRIFDSPAPPAHVTGVLVEHATLMGMGAHGSAVVIEGTVVRDTAPDTKGADGMGLSIYAGDDGTPSAVQVVSSLVERNLLGGLVVADSGLTIDATVVRDTKARQADASFGWGVGAAAVYGPGSKLVVRRSVIQHNVETGVSVAGSEALIESTVVRDTEPNADGHFGRGVDVVGTTSIGARATIRASLITSNLDAGVAAVSADVTIEDSIVRDTKAARFGNGGVGVWGFADFQGGRANLSVARTLVQNNVRAGVLAAGSDLALEDSLIVDTQPSADGDAGAGIHAGADELGGRASMKLARSVIRRSHKAGLLVEGADATVTGCRIVETLPRSSDKMSGAGIATVDAVTFGGTVLDISDSVVEESHAFGILIFASDVTIDASVVRATQPQEADGYYGIGLSVAPSPEGHPARLTTRWSAFEDNRTAGINIVGAEALIEGVAIRDTAAQVVDGHDGDGIVVYPAASTRSSATVRGSTIVRCRAAGITADMSDVTAEDVLVQDTQPDFPRGVGRGMNFQNGSHGVVRGSAVIGAYEVGITALDADVEIDDTRVEQVRPRASDAASGDGVVIQAGDLERTLRISGSTVESNARAGVAGFGGHLELEGTVLECNPIDLDGERAATFEDGGGNTCGCDGQTWSCKLLSAGLAPPEAL